MTKTLLLIIIYIAFISLGLPDAVLGVTWPVMRIDFGLELDMIGYVSIVITIATVLSSLLSGYIIQKIGTAKVTLFSVLFTAVALLGISFIPSFYWLLLLAFPLGFGAGSIDTALNNYVALHYKAHHMNWLHSFWGVGASLGPIIMSLTLLTSGWRNGFLTISIVQLVFFLIILGSLPLWKREPIEVTNEQEETYKKEKNLIRKKGVLTAVGIFIIYCAIEFSVGLWGSSFLVESKNFNPSIAARIVAFYYGGITLGRFISGFLTFKLNNKQMIYLGISITFIGTLLINFNISNNLMYIHFGIIGLGLSPIFPAMIHETPNSFGKKNSQHVIGYQMAGAYIGASVFPPIFGILARNISINIFPIYIVILGVLLLFLVNTLFIQVKQKR